MNWIWNYLVLPEKLSPFEEGYLTRMNQVALWFFLAHLPLFVLISAVNETGIGQSGILTSLVLLGPVIASRWCHSLRLVSVVMGVTAMLMGGVLVHIGQGPMQIEMHFYFFVSLALLAVFANPMVIVVAAITVAIHHLILWLIIPGSVFNYDAPLWVVGVHAAFVGLESVASCYVARGFFDNVVELEKKITTRNAEVHDRNRDLRMLLDAVEQGFFTIDRNLVMSEERSAAVDRLLGTPTPGMTFPDFIRPFNAKVADWLALCLGEVFCDLLPVEVTIGQLPSRLRANGRVLRIEYTPVYSDGELHALAVMLVDVTAQVERERLEADNRILMAVAQRVSRDRASYLQFYQETNELVEALRSGLDSIPLVRRLVHTMKGNVAIYELDLVAEACHRIEDHFARTGSLPEESYWEELYASWESVCRCTQRLVGEVTSGIQISEEEYEEALAAVLANSPHPELARRMASWELEPTSKQMCRIAEQAEILARRLGKGNIQVRMFGGHLRIDQKHWSHFWSSFVHVVRNAVDHGLEPEEERRSLGKAIPATIELATEIRSNRFVVWIRDDGRGIAWDKVARKAQTRGLPAHTQEQLVEALYADGLSTADSVTELSGRGVGMGVVRAVCIQLGGLVSVESSPGAGTIWRFSFPLTAMAPGTVELLSRHGVPAPERAFIREPPLQELEVCRPSEILVG